MLITSYDAKTGTGPAKRSLIGDLLVRLGWADSARAEHLVTATLHGIQARIPEPEFACLLRKLSPMVRPVCPATPPSARRERTDGDGFVAQIRTAAPGNRADISRETVSAVFAVLAIHVLPDEDDDDFEALARRLLDLWPTDR